MLESWLNVLEALLLNISGLFACVFFLSKTRMSRRIMVRGESSIQARLAMALLFGLLGIWGTHHGIPIEGGFANARAVGVIVGGLFAGPFVGLGSGVIAGIHRYLLGGFTAEISAWSTVFEGVAAGLCGPYLREKRYSWPYAYAVALVLECLHMALLLAAPPLEQSVLLVRSIAPAMIILNPLGVAAVIAFLQSVHDERQRLRATAAQISLQIADRTLPLLRKGLRRSSSAEVATIILNEVSSLDAVAVTSRDRVLAFAGIGIDHHSPELTAAGIITESTRTAIETGEPQIAQNRKDVGCKQLYCPLGAKIAVPLKENDETMGTLVLYKTAENSITAFEIELALGLGRLMSTQLELSRGEFQKQLLSQAEIRALQAQINPHFLFNALNTIAFYCRTDSETARNLLINLGDYYRNNTNRFEGMVDLATEIRHVESYVSIEKARFREKLTIEYSFSPEAQDIYVPPLVLQPLVENAILHGLLPKKNGGKIVLSSMRDADEIVFSVEDDGVGMDEERLRSVLVANPLRRCIGLSNVNERLRSLFGTHAGLVLESELNRGTRVSFRVPLRNIAGREGEH
jgi:two-component system sensor histidine kinase LytS